MKKIILTIFLILSAGVLYFHNEFPALKYEIQKSLSKNIDGNLSMNIEFIYKKGLSNNASLDAIITDKHEEKNDIESGRFLVEIVDGAKKSIWETKTDLTFYPYGDPAGKREPDTIDFVAPVVCNKKISHFNS